MAARLQPRVAIVTGDVTIDWNLARTRRDRGDASAWNADDSTRACWQRGGAALVADLVTAVTAGLPKDGEISWTVRQMGAPPDAVRPEDLPYPQSYATWANRARPGDAPAWRVDEFLGLDPGPAPGTLPGAQWKKVVDDTPDADVVILDDAALGFREDPALWPAALSASGHRPWVLLKMARPVAQGRLWEHVRRHHGDRLIAVLTVNDLRRTEVQISRELSWERTAQDLAWEIVHNPRVNGLSACAHVLVSFDTAGVFLLSRSANAHPTHPSGDRPACRLFFDPKVIEGGWNGAHTGGMIGYTSCLFAAVARQVMLSPETPNVAGGIQAGLRAMRALHIHGYGSGDTAPVAGLAFPIAFIAAELEKTDASFAVADVQDPARFLTEGATGDGAGRGAFWSILQDKYTGNLGSVAEQIALGGVETALKGVPLGHFGKLYTVDRREIENFRSIRTLVHEYWRRGSQKPISIAVFGAPGSGKSFGVIQIAEALLPKQIEVCQFNLSQFARPDDLLDALHQVRDIGLSGLLPLVFWDEFDTTLNGQRLGWLRQFLAPMQDGRFQEGQLTHPIGRSVFVFAGGTRSTMALFERQLGEDEWKSVKGPDFVSRLKGYVDILGPNPQPAADGSSPDSFFILRRAMLLHSILKRDASQLFQREERRERLNIDRGVLRAFLHTRIYKHGVRSMESIVAMSTLKGKTAYERSSLPAGTQLELHVDAQDFQSLVQQIELDGELLERLARAAHETYCAGKTRDGWRYGENKSEPMKTHPLLVSYDALPDLYKESNRATVRNIPKKLAAAGYVMIPSRSNEPPFSFPGADLERLARLEHELWMEARIAEGWRPGNATPGDPKRNEYLVEWNQVPDAIKEIDRDLVRGIPGILAQAGYAIVNVHGEAREAGATRERKSDA